MAVDWSEIEKLGTDIEDTFDISKKPDWLEVVTREFQKFANDLQESITKAGYGSGGQLYANVAVPVSIESDGILFEIEMIDYYKFLDAGVKGTEGGSSRGRALGYDRDWETLF